MTSKEKIDGTARYALRMEATGLLTKLEETPQPDLASVLVDTTMVAVRMWVFAIALREKTGSPPDESIQLAVEEFAKVLTNTWNEYQAFQTKFVTAAQSAVNN